MASDILLEEFEVLESIYPTELSKISERDIHIDVEPDDPLEGAEELKLALDVHYTDDYPDALPELSLAPIEGDVTEDETETLLQELKTVGEENLGMAMTFTLVSHLRERLSSLVRSRAERRRHEEAEKERLVIEAEEARTRGTPVTAESFAAWKLKFDKELAIKRARDDEEKMKALSMKEREEYKKFGTRPTGRQLFERDRNLATSDSTFIEDGAVSVDISQYERDEASEDEEEQGHVTFSDSE